MAFLVTSSQSTVARRLFWAGSKEAPPGAALGVARHFCYAHAVRIPFVLRSMALLGDLDQFYHRSGSAGQWNGSIRPWEFEEVDKYHSACVLSWTDHDNRPRVTQACVETPVAWGLGIHPAICLWGNVGFWSGKLHEKNHSICIMKTSCIYVGH